MKSLRCTCQRQACIEVRGARVAGFFHHATILVVKRAHWIKHCECLLPAQFMKCISFLLLNMLFTHVIFFSTIMLLGIGNSLKRADTNLLRNTLKFFYNDNHFIRFAENSIPIWFCFFEFSVCCTSSALSKPMFMMKTLGICLCHIYFAKIGLLKCIFNWGKMKAEHKQRLSRYLENQEFITWTKLWLENNWCQYWIPQKCVIISWNGFFLFYNWHLS